jgi:hypothetical protein
MRKNKGEITQITINEVTYFTPKRFAALNNVSFPTVYKWINEGMTKDGKQVDVIERGDKTYLRFK